MPKRDCHPETLAEEIASAVTHGFGLLLSLAGLPVLVTLAALYGNVWHVLGCAVFASTLVICYANSTLYHALRSPGAKRLLRVLDHCSIYLLIAGTYTPFTLVNLRGPWGWTLFALVWGLAAFGVVFKCFCVDRFQVVSTIGYLGMGWLALIAIKPLVTMVPLRGVAWLLAGGLAYSLGLIFFTWQRVRYNHAIWHLFVLAGSVCHYVAVMLYVVPGRA